MADEQVEERHEEHEPERGEEAPWAAEAQAAAEPEAGTAGEAAPEAQAEPEEAPSEPEEAQAAPARTKRKRLPRALRPARTKPKRKKPAERRQIVRPPNPPRQRGRRQERQGTVVSAAADKTIVVRVDVVKLHPKYKKVVRRSTKFHAHDERNEAKVGDVVRIVETRPLSRLKRWRLQEIVEAAR